MKDLNETALPFVALALAMGCPHEQVVTFTERFMERHEGTLVTSRGIQAVLGWMATDPWADEQIPDIPTKARRGWWSR